MACSMVLPPCKQGVATRINAARLRRQPCRAGDKGRAPHTSRMQFRMARERGGYLTSNATRRPCAPHVHPMCTRGQWLLCKDMGGASQAMDQRGVPEPARNSLSCMRGPIVHARHALLASSLAAERGRSARLMERAEQSTESAKGSVRPVVGACSSRLQRACARPIRSPSKDSRGRARACARACASLTGWSRSWVATCRASRCTSQRLSPPLIQDQSLLPRLTAMIAACAP